MALLNSVIDIKKWLNSQVEQVKQEKQKVYFIKNGNKRFNSKKFDSYESARKYVRRLITKKFGRYMDNIGDLGFSIDSK